MTVQQVINDNMLLWGVEDPAASVVSLRNLALTNLNSASQVIFAQAEHLDYFNRATLTVSVPANNAFVELPMEVQNVLGPARLAATGATLALLARRSDYDTYAQLYLGKISPGLPSGTPQAWFIERLNRDAADNANIRLWVTPVPDAATEVLLDVSLESPRYVWPDYCSGRAVQIPHRYVESILLPLTRHKAMTSHYFIKNERREQLAAEYQEAMLLLGLVDPAPKETKADAAPRPPSGDKK